MREIALHLLDIAENSVAAQAETISITVVEDLCADRLSAVLKDDGKGMDAETMARLSDPFFTSRTTRKVGLGIPLLKAAAEACQGSLYISSEPGKGAELAVEFQRSHIDRMPLGDLSTTLMNLVVAYPEIHWSFTYRAILPGADEPTACKFEFDDKPLKEALGDLPLSEPDVLAFLRDHLEQGIAEINNIISEAVLSQARKCRKEQNDADH